MKEVQEHKSVVDKLNEVSNALLELVPWRAREGLDKLITEDNERYRSASDAISQHVDQTGAAILKSQQVRCCKYVNTNNIDQLEQISCERLLIACCFCCDNRPVFIRPLIGLHCIIYYFCNSKNSVTG